MAARRADSRHKGNRRHWWLRAVIALIALGVIAVPLRYPITKIFSPRTHPSVASLDEGIDSAYSRIEPHRISTSTVSAQGREIRHDDVELSRRSSTLRANLEITREVERAGGEIVYGIESRDTRGRGQLVTLGISDGDSLVREIRLEKRIR